MGAYWQGVRSVEDMGPTKMHKSGVAQLQDVRQITLVGQAGDFSLSAVESHLVPDTWDPAPSKFYNLRVGATTSDECQSLAAQISRCDSIWLQSQLSIGVDQSTRCHRLSGSLPVCGLEGATNFQGFER